MSDIFVSYRRSDASDATGRVFDRLKAHFGSAFLFLDEENIPLGSDYRVIIHDALGRCKVMLVVIGDDWLTCLDENGQRRIDDPADPVHLEVATALERRIPLIPLLVEGMSIPLDELPPALLDLNYLQGQPIRPGVVFQHDIQRLCDSLERFVPAKPTTQDHIKADITARVHARLRQIDPIIRSQAKWEQFYYMMGIVLVATGLLGFGSTPFLPGASMWAPVMGGLFAIVGSILPFRKTGDKSDRITALKAMREQFDLCASDPSQTDVFETTEQRLNRLLDRMLGTA